MDAREDSDGVSSTTQFIPLRRPYNRSQNSAVVIRQNRNTARGAPRPHSIGASIISNPKLVKGWQYYDNSPNQKNIRKYLSTVHIPCEEIDSDSGIGTGGGDSRGGTYAPSTSNSGSPYRDSYRRGVGVVGADEYDAGDDYVPGVEVQACVAPDSDLDDDNDYDDTGKGRCYHYLGILLTIVASSALALSSVLVESLPRDKYSPHSVSVWSFQGILLPSLVIYLFSLCRVEKMEKDTISIIIEQTTSLKKKCGTGALILVRGLFGWAGVVLTIYSMDYVQAVVHPAIVTFVIIAISPVFIGVAACCYLKERMGLVHILAGGVVLAGVGMITVPPLINREQEFDKDQLIGTAMAVGCTLLWIFSVVILRYVRVINFGLITFVFGLVGTVGSLSICFIRDAGFQFPQGGRDWGKAGSIMGLTFIGHNLMTIALKHEKAGIFGMVWTWTIPITLLWQFLILRQRPDLLSLIGASLVVLGVLVMTARKCVQSMPKSAKTRRWCRCLLI